MFPVNQHDPRRRGRNVIKNRQLLHKGSHPGGSGEYSLPHARAEVSVSKEPLDSSSQAFRHARKFFEKFLFLAVESVVENRLVKDIPCTAVETGRVVDEVLHYN